MFKWDERRTVPGEEQDNSKFHCGIHLRFLFISKNVTMSNVKQNLLKALRWTCVVQCIMGLIFVGAVIDSTEQHSITSSVFKVCATFPSFVLALVGLKILSTEQLESSLHRRTYLCYAIAGFIIAISEGYGAKLCLHGLQQVKEIYESNEIRKCLEHLPRYKLAP